jgi:hypothetical protein
VETDHLRDTPCRVSFSLASHPVLHVLICLAFGLVTGVAGSLFLGEVFGTVTWNTVNQFVELDVTMPFSTRERFIIYILFSLVPHPWLGLLWGIFVGTIITGATIRPERAMQEPADSAAEHLVTKPKGAGATSRWIPSNILGMALLRITVAWIGGFFLGVSVLTTTFGLFASTLLLLLSRKKVYRRARAKCDAALDEELIPAAESNENPHQKIKVGVIAALSACYIVFVSIGLWYVWPEIKEARISMSGISGRFLTQAEADTLERNLQHHPDDLSAHVQLFNYYHAGGKFPPPDTKDWFDVQRQYGNHVLWLIDHCPEYLRGRLPEFGQNQKVETVAALWQKRQQELTTGRVTFFSGYDKFARLPVKSQSEAVRWVVGRLCELGKPWDRRLAAVAWW